ncbi:hypothetical protein D3C83_296930 [compost metagenome]
MRVEDAGDPILEDRRFVRQPYELVVHVAEPVGHLVVDLRKLTTREAAYRVSLRYDDAP